MPWVVRVSLPLDTPGVLLYRNDSTTHKAVAFRIAHEGGLERPHDTPLQVRMTMRRSGVSFWKSGDAPTAVQVEPNEEVWASANPDHRIVALIVEHSSHIVAQ